MENAETAADDQVGNNEAANEAPSEGENAAQPISEGEQKGGAQGDNSEGKDVQDDESEVKGDQIGSSDKEQLENAEAPCGDEVHVPAGEVTEQGNAASAQYHSESGTRTMSRKIEIPNNKVICLHLGFSLYHFLPFLHATNKLMLFMTTKDINVVAHGIMVILVHA